MEDYTSASETPKGTSVIPQGKTQVLGVDFKTAGILCYLPIFPINLVASLVFLNSEPKSNTFLRFHAMQSIVMLVACLGVGIAAAIISFILGAIPIIGWMAAGLLGLVSWLWSLAWLGVSIWLIVCVSRGEMKSLPYVGDFAKQRIGE